MGSSFLAINMQFGDFFKIFWKIFQDKGKIIKYRLHFNVSMLFYRRRNFQVNCRFGGFYIMLKAGVDIVGFLEMIGTSQKVLDYMR